MSWRKGLEGVRLFMHIWCRYIGKQWTFMGAEWMWFYGVAPNRTACSWRSAVHRKCRYINKPQSVKKVSRNERKTTTGIWIPKQWRRKTKKLPSRYGMETQTMNNEPPLFIHNSSPLVYIIPCDLLSIYYKTRSARHRLCSAGVLTPNCDWHWFSRCMRKMQFFLNTHRCVCCSGFLFVFSASIVCVFVVSYCFCLPLDSLACFLSSYACHFLCLMVVALVCGFFSSVVRSFQHIFCWCVF